MTEEEWRTSTDPWAMCKFVRDAMTSWKTRWQGRMSTKRFQVSHRTWRMAGLAVCEQVARVRSYDQLDALLPAARKHARADLPHMEKSSAATSVLSWLRELRAGPGDQPHSYVYRAWRAAAGLGLVFATPVELDRQLAAMAEGATHQANMLRTDLLGTSGVMRFLSREEEALADDLRDILGNVFIGEKSDRIWGAANDGAARRLAEFMDHTGDYRDMPVLGDALEEAGCTSEAILRHCRWERHHAAGCWVVELLLGRE